MNLSNAFDFSGQTVLITGSGGGIGAGIALRFAQGHANVVINYRSSFEDANIIIDQIRDIGASAIAIQGDVTQADDVHTLFAQAVEAFGHINILINNAGIYPLHNMIDMDVEDWDAVIHTNLRSAFLCTQAFARHTQAQTTHNRAIINIATIEGEHPAHMHSHYNTSKGGLLMFNRASALELGQYGIRVNAVSPGLIWREGIEEAWADGVQRYRQQAPLGKLGTVENVADACLFLASPFANWITGTNLIVDGGVSASPLF